jgi:hypothetical protein
MLIVCALAWLISNPALLAAEPMEQLKAFISNKPTIEKLEFRVNTTKYAIRGLDSEAYRIFSLTMQDSEHFKLFEDKSGYVLRIPSAADPSRIVDFKPLKEAAWAQFGNQVSTMFNSNRVNGEIMTIVDPASPPTFGPARETRSMIGVAYDALNFGILELGASEVKWSGNAFVCASNRLTNEMRGVLEMDAAGQPSHVQYTIFAGNQTFHYRALLEFLESPNRPQFFPSRIRIYNLQSTPPKLVSDYDIVKLVLSDRKLAPSDVALYPANAQIPRYVYTNGQFFRVQSTNAMVLLTAEPRSSGSRRELALFVLIGVLILPPAVLTSEEGDVNGKALHWQTCGPSLRGTRQDRGLHPFSKKPSL